MKVERLKVFSKITVKRILNLNIKSIETMNK